PPPDRGGSCIVPAYQLGDPLFRQQAAEDVFPYDALTVNQEAGGQADDAVPVGDPIVVVHHHQECMAVGSDVFGHLPCVFQLIDGQHHKALVTKLVVTGLHGRHLLCARLAPGRPEIEKHDFAVQIRESHLMTLEILERDLRGGAANHRRSSGHTENSYYADTDTHADN